VRHHVSPAHAGIDPLKAIACYEYQSLPRARGDRPVSVEDDYVECLSPPRTRGSTLKKKGDR